MTRAAPLNAGSWSREASNLPPTARKSAAGEGRMTPNPASSAVEEEDMGSALEETAAVSQEARPDGQHSAGWGV